MTTLSRAKNNLSETHFSSQSILSHSPSEQAAPRLYLKSVDEEIGFVLIKSHDGRNVSTFYNRLDLHLFQMAKRGFDIGLSESDFRDPYAAISLDRYIAN